jgi:hypothetical protein
MIFKAKGKSEVGLNPRQLEDDCAPGDFLVETWWKPGGNLVEIW